VPKTYERVNHLLTFGLDILWRKKVVQYAIKKGGSRWLDVCTGTGETAVYLSQQASENKYVFAVDFTLPMLQEAVRKTDAGNIHFSQADARKLPFPDRSFDLITISFATRNLNLNHEILIQTFMEFHRVLIPGGWFVNLETSQPRNPLIQKIFHFYIRALVQQLGYRISGSNVGYAYLARTIPRFYTAEELSNILIQAGFKTVEISKMLLGAIAIHAGSK